MDSGLAWLDYSEYERRKALDVIALFRDQDTVDELGLGVIRDHLADRFFPGTSTIQTRARYFLLIPWIYRDLERRRVESSSVAARARHQELDLIEVLAEKREPGIIGIQARRTLKRLPSNIYWRGLAQWGILLFPGSQAHYQRSLDRFYQLRPPPPGDGDTSPAVPRRNWHANLPEPPEGFPNEATLKLRREEGRYLRERVLAMHPDSLLAHLLDQEILPEADFAWEQPDAQAWRGSEELFHGQCFSEATHGAALLYNLMLAELVPNPEWIETYREGFETWSRTMALGRPRFARWNRDEFWLLVSGGRVGFPTRAFVDAWLNIALDADPATIAGDERARRLIADRELTLKRGRARLHNPKARGLWNGKSGTAQLDYRWDIAKTIVMDIVTGLRARA